MKRKDFIKTILLIALYTTSSWGQQIPISPTNLIVDNTSNLSPPLYDEFVTLFTNIAESSANNFAAGGFNVEADEYKENGIRSVFYSGYDNLWRAREWGIRTGNSVIINQEGLERALDVQLHRWGKGPTPAWHRAADVPYHALQRGESYFETYVIMNDLFRHIHGWQSSNNPLTEGAFVFGRLNEFGSGLIDTTSPLWKEIRFTSKSRSVMYLARANIYWERAGNSRWVDQQQGIETLPWLYMAMINHLYRWKHEFLNQESSNSLASDSSAYFMMSTTIDTLRICREWFLETGENPEQYMPTQVLYGDYLDESSILFYVDNPWTTTIEAITKFLDWQFAAIDGVQIFNTPYPATSPYFRVTKDNVDRFGIQKIVGDPMLNIISNGFVETLHRSDRASPQRDIQMMNVINLWWMASELDGIDNVRRDKYIRWGDLIFAGAVDNGIGFTQKAKNQQMYVIWEALEYRNAVRNRND